MGGGCGGLSLLGLLVGVGLTVWLGSMVMGGSLGGDSPKANDAETLASVVDSSTTAPGTTALAVSVNPATDLGEGAEVSVTSDAFPAGAEVRVDTCLARANTVTGDAARCDAPGSLPAQVDAKGHLAVRYVVARVVTVGGVPYDCGTKAGLCVVAVTDAADPTRTGSVPISYQEGIRGPEITLPDLGG